MPVAIVSSSLVSECSLTYYRPVSPRANALPPTERRVAIVRSALGLIRERGTIPTTREIAEAAGIAEGTIFRAFDTKERLMDAVVGETFCPAPVSIQLHAIDHDQPLRPKLVAFVTVLQDRFTEIFDVMSALGLSAPPAGFEEHRGCSPETGHVPLEEQDLGVGSTWDPERRRLVGFLDHDADRFTCAPEELLRYLRLLTFSGTHPGISEGRPLTPEAIVDLVLDGVLITRTKKAS